MRNQTLAWLLAGSVTGGAALATAAAWADGAIAVGTTGNVIRDGIAFGMVVDQPKEQAATIAVQRCRTFHAPAAANSCKVMATFAGECFAVAYDPKPATPGAGWGVGPDQDSANAKAIAMCEETAGPARRGYCQVESGGCDTTGRRPAAGAGASSSPTAEAALDGGPARQPAAGANTQPSQAGSPPSPVATPTPPADATAPSSRSTNSPLLPLGALVGVGLAYALGQYLRGRLEPAQRERQLLTGGSLGVAAAVIAKLLDMAGMDAWVTIALAALAAAGALLLG